MILSNNNGTFTPVAGGNGTFIGTAAAFNAVKDTLPVNTVAYITDDGNGDLQPVDAVTNGDMHPVTSNAVYDKLDVVGQVYDISPAAFTLSGNSQTVNCGGSLNKGKYIIEVSLMGGLNIDDNYRLLYDNCRLFVGPRAVVDMGRCRSVTGQVQQTGIGFAKITADNTVPVLLFEGHLAGASVGDISYWYVKAIRIG